VQRDIKEMQRDIKENKAQTEKVLQQVREDIAKLKVVVWQLLESELKQRIEEAAL